MELSNKKNSRSRRLLLASTAAAALLIGPALISTPAFSTTLDASGVSLDFSNPTDTGYLGNSTTGNSQQYEGVATIGGTVVDAIVTVVGVSDSSVGTEEYMDFDASEIDLLNTLNADLDPPVDPLTPGCYSNDDYWLNLYTYAERDFRLSDLLPSGRVTAVDAYDDDPAYNSTINSEVNVCDDANGDENGFVTIRVNFEVDGDPVTLTNVALNITDLDNQQEMLLSSPKPSSWIIDGESLVTVTETDEDSLLFTGAIDPSPYEAPFFPERYTAEALYDSVSELTYEFRIVDSSHGSVQVAFDTYFTSAEEQPAPTLAATGTNTGLLAGIVFAGFGLGTAILIARRTRSNLS